MIIKLATCGAAPALAASLLAPHLLLLLAAFAQLHWAGGQGLPGVLRAFRARRHSSKWQHLSGNSGGSADGSGGNGHGLSNYGKAGS